MVAADIFDWLVGWYNLPFLVTVGIALGMVLIEMLTGGLSELLPSLDMDFDTDTEFDVDLDADMGTGAAPAWAVGLGWMGFGKAPITVLIEVLFASFGMVGLLVTALAHDIYPGLAHLAPLVAVPVAAVVAVMATKGVGALIYKYIPPSASSVKNIDGYVGEAAVAVVRLTPTAGEVKVEGVHQPVFLNARADTILPPGSEVVLVSFDKKGQTYKATLVS